MSRIVVMNRGDTCRLVVSMIDINENPYELEAEDKIYFGLMDPHQPFEYALLKKVFTGEQVTEDSELEIELAPVDTLDLYPGIYYYAVKMKLVATGEVITLINKTKFIINS